MSKKKKSDSPKETSPRMFARRRETSLGHKVGNSKTLYNISSAKPYVEEEPPVQEAPPIPDTMAEPEVVVAPPENVPSEARIPSAKIHKDESSWWDPTQGPIRAGLEHANDALYGGFSGEIRGGLDTAVNTLSGKLPRTENGFLSDVADDYSRNRQFYEDELQRYSKESPTASIVGGIAGSLPAFPLFKGASSYGRIGKAGVIGGVLGLGASNADLTKGEYGKALGDAATGAATLGLLGAASEGLSQLAPLFRPKMLDAIAAHNRVAGGGDARMAGTLKQTFENELPDSVKGFLQAEKKGFLKRDPGFVSNFQPETPTASEWLNKPWQSMGRTRMGEMLRREFQRKSEIDYDKLRGQLGNSLKTGREEKLSMLSPIQDKKVDFRSMLGKNPTATELRIYDAVKGLDEQINKYGLKLPHEEASSLQALKKGLSKEQTTVKDLEKLSQNLGILTSKSAGKKFPDGSPQKELLDTKARIDSKIVEELETYKKGLGKRYLHKNESLHNEAEFLDTVKEGQEKYLRQWGADPRFEGGIISSAIEKMGGGKANGLGISELIGSALNSGEKLLGRSLQFGGMGLKPQAYQWLPKVFNSYDPETNKLKTHADRDLHNSYVDNSVSMSPREKARQKYKTNIAGDINTAIVPGSVQKNAATKIEKEDAKYPGDSPPSENLSQLLKAGGNAPPLM